MIKPEAYLSELNQLITSYGIDEVAALLGKSSRGVANWISENPKVPHEKTKMKISELFRKHQNGSVNDFKAQHAHDYRDEVIALLKEKINLSEQKQLVMLQRNNALLNAIVETLPILVSKMGKKELLEAHGEMNKRIEHHLDALKKESI